MPCWSPGSYFCTTLWVLPISELPAPDGQCLSFFPASTFLRVDHDLVSIPQGQWVSHGLLFALGCSDVGHTVCSVPQAQKAQGLPGCEGRPRVRWVDEEKAGEPGAWVGGQLFMSGYGYPRLSRFYIQAWASVCWEVYLSRNVNRMYFVLTISKGKTF